MAKKYVITLNEAEYNTLLDELYSLDSYLWRNDRVHANNCNCKSFLTVEKNCEEKDDESERN